MRLALSSGSYSGQRGAYQRRREFKGAVSHLTILYPDELQVWNSASVIGEYAILGKNLEYYFYNRGLFKPPTPPARVGAGVSCKRLHISHRVSYVTKNLSSDLMS